MVTGLADEPLEEEPLEDDPLEDDPLEDEPLDDEPLEEPDPDDEVPVDEPAGDAALDPVSVDVVPVAAAASPALELCDGVVVVVVGWRVVAPSAGSCPVTSRPKIATQATRNSASVAVTTQRRIRRARRLCARTRSRARRRPSSGVGAGGGTEGVCMHGRIASLP